MIHQIRRSSRIAATLGTRDPITATRLLTGSGCVQAVPWPLYHLISSKKAVSQKTPSAARQYTGKITWLPCVRRRSRSCVITEVDRGGAGLHKHNKSKNGVRWMPSTFRRARSRNTAVAGNSNNLTAMATVVRRGKRSPGPWASEPPGCRYCRHVGTTDCHQRRRNAGLQRRVVAPKQGFDGRYESNHGTLLQRPLARCK